MGGILSGLIGGDAAAAAAAAPDEAAELSPVAAYHSADRWQLYFNSCKQLNKLVVVDFTATWCGPCKFMAPAFADMAAKYTNVDFVKIDVDELSGVAQEFKVQAMPTFLFLKQGKEVDRVVGAKKDELENKILKHREVPKFAA